MSIGPPAEEGNSHNGGTRIDEQNNNFVFEMNRIIIVFENNNIKILSEK